MTANYIDMKMTNVRLISAEITNRPYEKITPSCYLSGTTSGTGRAEITVNAKVPLKIDVTPLHTLPSITFHGNNEIEDNVGRQALTGRKEFKFSGANVKPLRDFTDGTLSTLGKNFAHNLSKYKIRYTLQDAKITNATLTKQFIRHYGCHFNRGEDGKALIINDGRQGVQLRASDWGRYVYCYPGYASSPNQSADKILLTSDSCLSMTGSEIWSGFNGWGFADLDIDATFGLPGINKPFVFWSYGGWRTDQKHYIGDKQKYINTSTYYLDSITVDDSVSTLDSEIYVRASVNQFFIENLNDKSLLDTALDTTGRYDEAIQQNEGIALQHLSSDLSDKIVAGDYICFQGDGELTVTVEPTDLGSSFSYLDAQKSNISMEINNTQTVIISPETHYYEPLSDGKYQITLNIELVQLSNLQLLDPSVAFTYKNPRLPRDSRVVDFSKNIGNSPEYNSALISRLSLNLLTYDNDLQYWISSKTSSYPYSEFYNNNIVGDFYFLVEDIGSIAPQIRFFNRSKGPETFSGVKNELYLVPGLHRRYQYFSDTRRKEMASFDWPNSPQGGQVKYIWAGFTMPVNAMLYYGAGEGTTHKYQWQSDKRGENVILGPTEAVKNVTKDACAKLKSDWGSNLRLYIIKYRKQTQYKHLVTGSNVNFDYSYLNNCATGTAAPYMYDVSDESGLKTALDTIATDIKNWAGYEEAKNVSEND